MSSKPRVVIAGAGQSGRALSSRLSSLWEVVVIDSEPQKEPLLSEVTFVPGDATSSLVLKQAGMQGAAAAIALTGRDDVNLEFCRLARQIYEVPQVLSAARQSEQLPIFEELGVLTISRPDSIASTLQTRLERGKRTTADVGLGQGEILEVTVLPNSPVIGKSMIDLSPQAWLVAAIYRKGHLVVPHGKTCVEEGDRVLLVGEPAILPAIADFFRAGESEFPLQFGNKIVIGHPAASSEAEYLAQNTKALGTSTLPEEAGCLALSPPPTQWIDNLGFSRSSFVAQVEAPRAPVLLARGTFPYQSIVVAVSPGRGGEVELAIDVARMLGVEKITAVAVLPPTLVSGAERLEELEKALERAVRLGKAYRLEVLPVTLHGNPVRQLIDYSKDFSLLVMGHQRGRGVRLTRPDVSRLLILKSQISTLVLCNRGR
jgi:Trk K+ transport system NAD-binding subunit